MLQNVAFPERKIMVELLAPAGSYEGLCAAVNAGADAVYIGGTMFGARAYAENPDEELLLQGIDYCHLRERKLYMTVNTLLKEEELENKLYDYLSDIEYTKLEINAEIVELAQKIIDMGILRPKSFDDCQHIAAAVVNACDCIISWNFRHIVNIKTIRGVRAITNLEGYKGIDIINPSVLLESEG